MTTSVRSEATRSIVVVNGVDRLALNDDGSMALLTPAANPTGNKVPTAGQLPFTKEYVSTEQTIVAAELRTLPHNLGKAPSLFRAAVVCKTAEHGYSVGDVLEMQHVCDVSDSTAAVRGMSLTSDGTNIYIRYIANTAVFQIINKTNGTTVAMTPANWRLIVRAWA